MNKQQEKSTPDDGKAALGVRELTPSSASPSAASPHAALKHAAAELGLVRWGIAAPGPDDDAQSRVEAWIEQGYHGTMQFMEAPRQTPEQLLNGVRSIVVAAVSTESPTQPSVQEGYIAAYARGADYHTVLKQKLWQLAQALCDAQGSGIRARVCVDTAPLLEREWARRAGVAFVGKSAMAIAPGAGTNLLLGALLTDLALPTTPPLPDGCGSCTRCIDACPTDAFAAPFVLDARRCVAYLTIEHAGDIPGELRSQVGTHVFGCDVCQQVCPYNASRKRPAALSELSTVESRRSADLIAWLRMTSGDYRRLTRDSALRRTPRARLQRNAALALGNALTADSGTYSDSQREAAVEALSQALLSHPNSVVRKQAAWSLGRVAGSVTGSSAGSHPRASTQPPDHDPAVAALHVALTQEADPLVVAEVQAALQHATGVPG